MDFKGKRILITSGPTAVLVDDMRVITNRSTGTMGRLIANFLADKKASVTLLEGQVSTGLALSSKIKKQSFYLYRELETALKAALGQRWDCVIHAAAISDFELEKPFKGKISSGKPLVLRLKPTSKLINIIKRLQPSAVLVGFKLETSLKKDYIVSKAAGLFKDAKADVVVVNMQKGKHYQAALLSADGSLSQRVKSKEDIVKALAQTLDQQLLS